MQIIIPALNSGVQSPCHIQNPAFHTSSSHPSACAFFPPLTLPQCSLRERWLIQWSHLRLRIQLLLSLGILTSYESALMAFLYWSKFLWPRMKETYRSVAANINICKAVWLVHLETALDFPKVYKPPPSYGVWPGLQYYACIPSCGANPTRKWLVTPTIVNSLLHQ